MGEAIRSAPFHVRPGRLPILNSSRSKRLNSFTSKAKAASSKGFCICPRPKRPGCQNPTVPKKTGAPLLRESTTFILKPYKLFSFQPILLGLKLASLFPSPKVPWQGFVAGVFSVQTNWNIGSRDPFFFVDAWFFLEVKDLNIRLPDFVETGLFFKWMISHVSHHGYLILNGKSLHKPHVRMILHRLVYISLINYILPNFWNAKCLVQHLELPVFFLCDRQLGRELLATQSWRPLLQCLGRTQMCNRVDQLPMLGMFTHPTFNDGILISWGPIFTPTDLGCWVYPLLYGNVMGVNQPDCTYAGSGSSRPNNLPASL